ncbi:nSTAND1 domain-containing NTPase [Pseudoalteromonas sp. T1lg23B]|uniref:nSTAND1 domain-containing NTPase n=1 Tax=Pseudoalteromonas sp. T1lg23B TaxID=2077097 RepID=UPI001319F79E|nr:winged helix-turn-helix domain-containing protein [Pseudoalteromonas sp. T1lg23B]
MTGSTSKQLSPFYLNNTLVVPNKNLIERAGQAITIQPKQMEVLCYFAANAGELVTSDALIENCWPNQYISDSPLHKCIASLRKALDDDKAHPSYIKTLPKKGYLLVAHLATIDNDKDALSPEPVLPTPRWLNGNPYQGQEPYQTQHQDVFFGRQRFVHQCVQRLPKVRVQIITALPRQGSTSLLKAGLYPTLKKMTLKSESVFRSVFYYSLREHCAQSIRHIETTLVQLGAQEKLIVLLDDLDKVSLCSDALACIKRISDDSRIHWLVPCAHLLPSQRVNQLCATGLIADSEEYAQGEVILPLFSYADFYQIISRPFELAGNPLGNGIDELILDEVSQGVSSVGLLQRYLQQLYQKHSQTPLDEQRYQRFTFSIFLASYTAEVTQQLDTNEQAELSYFFPGLVTISSENHHQSVRQTLLLEEGADEFNMPVLQALIRADLLVPVVQATGNAMQQVELQLACDALLKEWHRLSKWITDNLNVLFLTQDISIAYNRWQGQKQHQDYLLKNPSQIKEIIKIGLLEKQSALINAQIKQYLVLSAKKYRAGVRLKRLVGAVLFSAAFALVLFGIKVNQQKEQISEANRAAENLISFMLSDLKAKLEPIGKLELLSMVANKTLQYFDHQGSEQLSTSAAVQLADAFTLLGQVAYEKRQFEQAHKLFRQGAQTLAAQLSKTPDDAPLLEQQMLNYFWLGQLHYQQEKYDSAEQAFSGYLSNAERLLALAPDNQHYQLELSYALNNLGAVAYKTNDILAAEQYFERSLSLKTQVLKYQPKNNGLISDIAGTYSWQGNIQDRKGALEKALPFYEKATELRKVIYNKDTENSINTLKLFDIVQKMSVALLNIGDYQRALDTVKSSNALIAKLLELDTENISHHEKSLINTLIELICYRLTGQHEQVLLKLATLDDSWLSIPMSERSILARSALKKIELERAYSLANRSTLVAIEYLKNKQDIVMDTAENTLLTLAQFVVFTRYIEMLNQTQIAINTQDQVMAEQWLAQYQPLIDSHINNRELFIRWEIVGHYLLLQMLTGSPINPVLLESFKASGYRPDEFTLLFNPTEENL